MQGDAPPRPLLPEGAPAQEHARASAAALATRPRVGWCLGHAPPTDRLATCAQVQHWAAQRDEQKALAFFCELMTFHSFEDLLVLDEMARDRSAMRSLFGWGSRGSAPIERNVPHYRGQRISALCVFTHRGFEDWRFTEGTYDAEAFDHAMDHMVLQPTGPLGLPLLQHFPAVLMDNATIHAAAFDERIRAAGGKVWRIPPYCATSLSPLDNGAFGLLTRYLDIHAARLAPMSVPDALSDALRNCCPPASARWCFHNCKYYSRVRADDGPVVARAA